jgi:FdhD protein
MATRNYTAEKLEIDEVNKTVDSLTVEEALQININGKAFTMTMRTPGDDPYLVRGLLHTEGILKRASYNPEVVLNKEDDETIITSADLTIPPEELGKGYTNSRSLLSVSSCGICGRTELGDVECLGKKINYDGNMDVNMINEVFRKMTTFQHSFRLSGGTHAAAAFTIDGELLCAMEDIGRHNAVDKVIGELVLSKRLKQASCLTVSGRISYEIVVKCFKARIPFLAAVSAPSTLAVDYAEELGITLFAFCRENRATCYSHAYRANNSSQTINTV